MQTADSKLSHNDFYDMINPFVMDMTAMYSLMQEDVMKIVGQAEKENWTIDKMIHEIERLI
jgi:hypothetical protein